MGYLGKIVSTGAQKFLEGTMTISWWMDEPGVRRLLPAYSDVEGPSIDGLPRRIIARLLRVSIAQYGHYLKGPPSRALAARPFT